MYSVPDHLKIVRPRLDIPPSINLVPLFFNVVVARIHYSKSAASMIFTVAPGSSR